MTAQSVAERQRAYRAAMKKAGYVRLYAYVTEGQREKYKALGGDEWLHQQIDRARVKSEA